jgi:hypothetical protein
MQVIANGQVISGVVEAEVISNNYFAADRFNVSVALGLDPWGGTQFWASETNITIEIQFSADSGASFTSLIQGLVDTVTIDPSLGLVHLDGRDLTALLIEAHTQETFANRTSSEIVAILAARHNLIPQASPTTTPVGRYYQSEHDRTTLDQYGKTTTEWDLLVFLARQEGFDIFVQRQTLYFQPSSVSSSVALTLKPSDVIDLRLERSLTLARDIQVVVKSWNSRQNSMIIQQALASGVGSVASTSNAPQCYVFVKPNLVPDDALSFARQRLIELTRHERAVEISMPGELTLTPRSIIALAGTATEFDQVYYVDVIRRRLRLGSGMTQRMRATNTSPRTTTTVATTLATSSAS